MSLQEASQEDHLFQEGIFPMNDETKDEEESPDKKFSQPHFSHHSPSREAKEGSDNAGFNAFKAAFDAQQDVEAKLQLTLDFMEVALAQGGAPHFRSFWEARRLAISLFKENLLPAVRSQFWMKYSELLKEARRLKEILEEQSSFAIEQIEIAIQALEKEITHFDEQVEKAPSLDRAFFPQHLEDHYALYENWQKQLNVLNVQATRINALRKEVLKTEMRVRQKNKFFQSLSAMGDQVFPKRKELIKQISQQFIDDVNQFIAKYFQGGSPQALLYVLREEIKAYQALAKLFTINTNAFTQTRAGLSQSWDKIKVEEKERKKERGHQRLLFKQHAKEIELPISQLKEAIQKGEVSSQEALKKIDEVVRQMRKAQLGREELRILRQALEEVSQLVQEKVKTEGEARQLQESERHRQQKEKHQALHEAIEQLFGQQEASGADELIAQREALLIQIHESPLAKNEKQELERLLKPLRDVITEKMERALLDLTDDDRQALQQLQGVLKQRQERRQEAKSQLETLRKAAGSSSLDFEKAMSYQTQMNEEKTRLEKINQSIQEVERKVVELQSKMKGKREKRE